MERDTMKFIYDIKHNDGCNTIYDCAVKSMCNITENKPDIYNTTNMFQICTNFMRDYVKTCDNPQFLLWEFFNNFKFDDLETKKKIIESILITLLGQSVRDVSGYVNGFVGME